MHYLKDGQPDDSAGRSYSVSAIVAPRLVRKLSLNDADGCACEMTQKVLRDLTTAKWQLRNIGP